MKGLLIPCFILACSQVQASFIQKYCSNPETTTQWAQGHNDNYIILTKRSWENGNLDEQTLILDSWTLKIDTLNKQEIDSQINTHCEDGSESGYVDWKTTELLTVNISNRDESALDSNIVGLNADGKVETFFLCETKGNSMTTCNP